MLTHMRFRLSLIRTATVPNAPITNVTTFTRTPTFFCSPYPGLDRLFIFSSSFLLTFRHRNIDDFTLYFFGLVLVVRSNSEVRQLFAFLVFEHRLRAELFDYKERCEQLLMTICKNGKVVEDLEEKCLCLEYRAASLAQENDSLCLALNIIQEKSEGKYHHQ